MFSAFRNLTGKANKTDLLPAVGLEGRAPCAPHLDPPMFIADSDCVSTDRSPVALLLFSSECDVSSGWFLQQVSLMTLNSYKNHTVHVLYRRTSNNETTQQQPVTMNAKFTAAVVNQSNKQSVFYQHHKQT